MLDTVNSLALLHIPRLLPILIIIKRSPHLDTRSILDLRPSTNEIHLSLLDIDRRGSGVVGYLGGRGGRDGGEDGDGGAVEGFDGRGVRGADDVVEGEFFGGDLERGQLRMCRERL
jgi:hypothetical protein